MNVPQALLQKLGITFVKEARGICEYRLDCNGLKIILAENHASPVVTVMPLYHVGSRNEAVGYTGATHILEHMMFKGVRNGRTGDIYNFPDFLRPNGGLWNATTWFDRTNYFEVVPRQFLEQCIAGESDRMRNLLIKDEERASEMTVVRNEMERGADDPTRVMLLQTYAVAFREHPYHHPTIGWKSDVEGISIDRLKQFYDDFYWPDNTSLLVMGDFESAHALELIAKYYGVHPRSSKPWPTVYTVEPPQEGERRFVINRAGDAPRVAVSFHVPEAVHPDTYSLAVMADVLGGSRKTSRLYKALVETKLAASASVWNFQQKDPGMFIVMATVAPGAKPEDVEAAICAELTRMAVEPPTEDELRRVRAANRKGTALAAADPMQMANQIGEAESVADWMFYVEYDDKYAEATAVDVQRVAKQYFHSDNRTVGYFIPKKNEAAGKNGNAASDAAAPAATATADGATAKSSFSAKTQKLVLDNGLTLLLMPAPGTGVVSIAGRLAAGFAHVGKEQEMIAILTADQLTSGSTTRSAEEVSATLEEMGASLRFAAGTFSTKFNTQVVPDDFNAMLGLIADLIRHPAFPEKELATARMQRQSLYERKVSDTEARAYVSVMQALYPPESIYCSTAFEQRAEQVKLVTTDHLHSFASGCYTPCEMVLAIVGEIDVDQAVKAVKEAFGDWHGGKPNAVSQGTFEMPTERKRIDIEIPDKSNASVVIGHPALLRRDADDFFAARLANAALGGDTIAARLGAKIRKEAGLSYGIYSHFTDLTMGGAPFLIQISVKPDNLDQVLAMVDEIVASYLKDGISPAELSRESTSAGGTFIVQLRRCDAIAMTMMDFESLGLGVEAMDTFATRIQSVTKEEVDAAIRKHIHPEAFVIGVAGTLKQ